MSRSQPAIIGLLIALLLSLQAPSIHPEAAPQVEAEQNAQFPASEVLEAVEVTLSAPHTSASWDSRLPEPIPFDLPLVYLHRQQQAAATAERTLTLHLAGLDVGAVVQAEAISWHENRATWEHHHQATQLDLPPRACTAQEPCAIQWTLDPETMLSDLYRLVLRDGEGNLLWENPDPERPDFVALDTWELDLQGYAVRIYYAALFPFARGEKQLYHRLTPEAVDDFIARQFAPIVAETWKTQFDAWGFGPIHPGWDADRVVEIIFTCPPFALLGGTGTYTALTYSDGSPYPDRRIWLLSSHNTLQAYDSLENGYKVILSHEFFHLVQWNVVLSAGCPAQTLATKQWKNVFLEAQAKAASAIQYPELELHQEHLTAGASEYSSTAQRFLTLRLETSYVELSAPGSDPYDAALYWRFLYERFGSTAVLHTALEEMACRPADDLPARLDQVLDAALARLGGPFMTYEQSLVAFAQANYALRLEDGRCTVEDLSACGGQYYDPDGLYSTPALEAELHYSGTPLAYAGSIPASFGADLIEIWLTPDPSGQPLRIAFRSEGARFSVQLWKLDHSRTRARTPHPETLAEECGATCRCTLPALDVEQCDRLALIIVRLDADEQRGVPGDYHLVVDRGL